MKQISYMIKNMYVCINCATIHDYDYIKINWRV